MYRTKSSIIRQKARELKSQTNVSPDNKKHLDRAVSAISALAIRVEMDEKKRKEKR